MVVRNIIFWLTYDFNLFKALIWLAIVAGVWIVLPLWVYQYFFHPVNPWFEYFDNFEIVGSIGWVFAIISLLLIFLNVKDGPKSNT